MPASDLKQSETPEAKAQWGKKAATPEEQLFLRGPQGRGFELGRAVRIFGELIHGFRALHFVGPCITVFGSARFPPGSRYYELTRDLGARIAEAGFTVMTGGGPGVMEAANRGAKEAGGVSIGCNIVLPQEQKPNPYLDKFVEFHYFFVRKVSAGEVLLWFCSGPGRIRPLDELFEVRRRSDRENQKLSGGAAGCRLLEAPDPVYSRIVAYERRDRSAGSGASVGNRFAGGGCGFHQESRDRRFWAACVPRRPRKFLFERGI